MGGFGIVEEEPAAEPAAKRPRLDVQRGEPKESATWAGPHGRSAASRWVSIGPYAAQRHSLPSA